MPEIWSDWMDWVLVVSIIYFLQVGLSLEPNVQSCRQLRKATYHNELLAFDLRSGLTAGSRLTTSAYRQTAPSRLTIKLKPKT